MKKFILTIGFFCWGIFCAVTAFSMDDALLPEDQPPVFWGEVKTPDGLKFSILTVKIQDWVKTPSSGPVKMTEVTYGVTNETDNRKVDLAGDFLFALTDEFGNVYQLLEKPVDYTQPVAFPNKNFPSLYPGEQFTASVFFEAPVQTSQVLSLTINAQNIGVAQDVSFYLPIIRALPATVKTMSIVSDEDLQVSLPSKPRKVQPGETIPIQVMVSDKVARPDSIYIIAPFHLYEDQEALGQYELRIPESQPDGPITVIILTNWHENGESQTLSKAFNVIVKRPKKPCSGSRTKNCSGREGLAQDSSGKPPKKF